MTEEKNIWDEAIGISKSSTDLSPSPLLKDLINKNIKGEITVEEIIERLKEYYEEDN